MGIRRRADDSTKHNFPGYEARPPERRWHGGDSHEGETRPELSVLSSGQGWGRRTMRESRLYGSAASARFATSSLLQAAYPRLRRRIARRRVTVLNFYINPPGFE